MRPHLAPVPKNPPSFLSPPITVKPRSSGIVDWLFGAGNTAPTAMHTEPRATPDIRVTPPTEGNFWVENFFNALTEATTLFAKRHVELVHQEDPSTVYKVREVKIECKDAPTQFLRDVLSLPPLVRNRVVKSRMQKAPGAECLSLTDFFGCTIAAEVTLVEGQVVQTMVSYSGSRFFLKFAFEGDYVTRAMPPEATPVPKAQAPTSPSSLANPASPSNPAGANGANAGNTISTITTAPPACAARPTPTDAAPPARETMLRSRLDDDAPSRGSRATPLQRRATPQVQAVAKLRLRSQGAEVVLPLWEDNFPYTVGRHPDFRGYSVRGQRDNPCAPLLAEVERPEFSSFVSREHIVLDSFDPSTRQFRVVAGKGRNGSYFQGTDMPSHFLISLAVMAKGDWLKLGGAGGDGILEIRLEAA